MLINGIVTATYQVGDIRHRVDTHGVRSISTEHTRTRQERVPNTTEHRSLNGRVTVV